MDDHIAEIHQNPLRRSGALNAERAVSLRGERPMDMIGDRPSLTFRIPGTDDKVVCD